MLDLKVKKFVVNEHATITHEKRMVVIVRRSESKCEDELFLNCASSVPVIFSWNVGVSRDVSSVS